MEPTIKRCYIEMVRERYQRSRKGKRGEILDEVVEKLGVGRRQARRIMEPKPPGRPGKPGKRGRPGRYQDAEFKGALRVLWRTMHYMCGRYLKAGLSDWLPPVEAERGRYPESIRERLFSISPATADRILKPYKALHGKSLTKAGGFRKEIPIQGNIWNIEVPGYLEADTVSHCGGSTLGEYLNTLTMVDIATTWTECRSVFGKASGQIVAAIEDIELHLPFEILGYDSDNGTEVLNQHVLRYFRDERIERNRKPVTVTRSREYRKNDNAHVEQRNDSVVRRWLGYDRFDFRELTPLVNHLLRDLACPLMNHFFPSLKLIDKLRSQSETRRIYSKPVTPYARVMASAHVSEEQKLKLRLQHEALNPLKLSAEMRKVRRQIDDLLKQLHHGKASALLAQVALLQNSVTQATQALPLRKS